MLMKTMNRGLTILEVLFAMVIILVGLVGVATMIPFAGRQANDSVQITQSLAAGESALAVFQSHGLVQPRTDAPWQIVDDVSASDADCLTTSYASMRNLYNDLQDRAIVKAGAANYDPGNGGETSIQYRNAQSNLALLQNQIIGTGFCIDPLFWGFQNRDLSPTKVDRFKFFPLRRTRFPYFDETTNPVSLAGGGDTPRLIRISITDPSGVDVNGQNGFLRAPSALRLATVSGGDLVQAAVESNKALGPIRSARRTAGGSLLDNPTVGTATTWMATLTPSVDTPIINPRTIVFSPGLIPRIQLLPEIFDLSVVVFAKRNVRESFSINTATGEIPTSERIAFVSDFGPEAMTTGTFDIQLSGSSLVDAKIRVGDWLMLSRNILVNPDKSSMTAIRQRHGWYRVVSVAGADSFPRQVRVAGAAWGWTKVEVDTFQKSGMAVPVSTAALPDTVATIMKDVVHVYERPVNLTLN